MGMYYTSDSMSNKKFILIISLLLTYCIILIATYPQTHQVIEPEKEILNLQDYNFETEISYQSINLINPTDNLKIDLTNQDGNELLKHSKAITINEQSFTEAKYNKNEDLLLIKEDTVKKAKLEEDLFSSLIHLDYLQTITSEDFLLKDNKNIYLKLTVEQLNQLINKDNYYIKNIFDGLVIKDDILLILSADAYAINQISLSFHTEESKFLDHQFNDISLLIKLKEKVN